MNVALATTDAEIERCFPVMQQLRPHLVSTEFVARVRRQQAEGYRLAYLGDAGAVCAVAGFRIFDKLHSGRTLYVDDLVTDAAQRSRGYGENLFTWLVTHARAEGCDGLDLDSGVQRFGAHRFYLNRRMDLTSHHFFLDLKTCKS
jgi:GNAT superfamily N-acetyltransferase